MSKITKQEALQKIEELKQYIARLDQLGHGDVVELDGGKRIVIETTDLLRRCAHHKCLLLDEKGSVTNWFNNILETSSYNKIGNVFKD